MTNFTPDTRQRAPRRALTLPDDTPRISQVRLHGASARSGIDIAPRISWELITSPGTPLPDRAHVRLLSGDQVVWARIVNGDPDVVELPRELLISDTVYRVEVDIDIARHTAMGSIEFRSGLLSSTDWSPSCGSVHRLRCTGLLRSFAPSSTCPQDPGTRACISRRVERYASWSTGSHWMRTALAQASPTTPNVSNT